MTNPFETIDARLSNIEKLLLDIKHAPNEQPVPSDRLTMEQAINFLEENGIPTKEGNLYKLTSKREIPCGRIGKRLVFSRKQLFHWIESRTIDKVKEREICGLTLADSAAKKFKSRVKGGHGDD